MSQIECYGAPFAAPAGTDFCGSDADFPAFLDRMPVTIPGTLPMHWCEQFLRADRLSIDCWVNNKVNNRAKDSYCGVGQQAQMEWAYAGPQLASYDAVSGHCRTATAEMVAVARPGASGLSRLCDP